MARAKMTAAEKAAKREAEAAREAEALRVAAERSLDSFEGGVSEREMTVAGLIWDARYTVQQTKTERIKKVTQIADAAADTRRRAEADEMAFYDGGWFARAGADLAEIDARHGAAGRALRRLEHLFPGVKPRWD